MKKILSILVLLGIYLGANAQGVNKVAVISITGYENLRLNLSDLGDLGVVMDITKSDFKSYNAFQDFHQYIFNNLANEFPFEFINEENVINNEVYKELKQKDDDRVINITNESAMGIEGYNINILKFKDNCRKYKEAMPEADAFLLAELKVEITPDKMINNTGTAVVKAIMTFKLLTPDAILIFSESINGYSKGNFKVVANQVVKGGDNIPLYIEQAVQDMYNSVPKAFPRILKVYNKKVKKFYS